MFIVLWQNNGVSIVAPRNSLINIRAYILLLKCINYINFYTYYSKLNNFQTHETSHNHVVGINKFYSLRLKMRAYCDLSVNTHRTNI